MGFASCEARAGFVRLGWVEEEPHLDCDDPRHEPPCINCGRPLEGPTYTGDCLAACDEECYEQAWLNQPARPTEAA